MLRLELPVFLIPLKHEVANKEPPNPFIPQQPYPFEDHSYLDTAHWLSRISSGKYFLWVQDAEDFNKGGAELYSVWG